MKLASHAGRPSMPRSPGWTPVGVRGRAAAGLVLGALMGLGVGCGALRQNLRNQFVSYRGAWQCPSPGCTVGDMQRATKNHREGEVNITHVKMQPRVAMAFYPGTPVETFTAEVSCGGNTAQVPADKVQAPGSHGLKAEPEAWLVTIDSTDYSFGRCKVWRVTTHATWENGKRSYDEQAGLQLQ